MKKVNYYDLAHGQSQKDCRLWGEGSILSSVDMTGVLPL